MAQNAVFFAGGSEASGGLRVPCCCEGPRAGALDAQLRCGANGARQQTHSFPFLVLSVFFLLDEASRWMARYFDGSNGKRILQMPSSLCPDRLGTDTPMKGKTRTNDVAFWFCRSVDCRGGWSPCFVSGRRRLVAVFLFWDGGGGGNDRSQLRCDQH